MSRNARRVSALVLALMLSVSLALPASALDWQSSKASAWATISGVWDLLVSMLDLRLDKPSVALKDGCESNPDGCEMGPIFEPGG